MPITVKCADLYQHTADRVSGDLPLRISCITPRVSDGSHDLKHTTVSLRWNTGSYEKKRLLIRIFKNFHSGWRCWQLSCSANRLQHRGVFLIYLCWKARQASPPVHHNLGWTGRPWLEWLWSLHLCGTIHLSTGMRSDSQTRWTRGETPLKILGSDQLGNKDNRLFSTEFQWIGKTKQTLERKTLSLDFQESWTYKNI